MSELNGDNPIATLIVAAAELRELGAGGTAASLVIYTAAGFLADWIDGGLGYTRRLENAALFTPQAAAWIAPRVNGAVLTTDGRLLTLAELLELMATGPR